MTSQLASIDASALWDETVEADAQLQVERALYQACSETGFVIVRGHGVSASLQARLRGAIDQLFEQPRERFASQIVQRDNYRGYVPLGYFTPNSGADEIDSYEAWKLHFEVAADDPICQASSLYGPNRWPAHPSELPSLVAHWWAEMTRVSNALLAALCRQMGLDVDYVLSCMQYPLTNMTLLNYPPSAPNDGWGIHPHKDFNLLTLLAHDPVGGLELRNREGHWVSADCPEDALVVNVGDMLELWSGGRLISTPHRVANRSGRARRSFPFFAVPRYDVTIEPLLAPLPGFNRQALHCGRASHDIWSSNWAGQTANEPGQELGDYAEK